jgi:hypothetical protein
MKGKLADSRASVRGFSSEGNGAASVAKMLGVLSRDRGKFPTNEIAVSQSKLYYFLMISSSAAAVAGAPTGESHVINFLPIRASLLPN